MPGLDLPEFLTILALVCYPVFLCFVVRPMIVEARKFQFRIADLLAFTVGFAPTPALAAAILDGHQELWTFAYLFVGGQLAGFYVASFYPATHSAWRTFIEVSGWTFVGGAVFPMMYSILLAALLSLIVVAYASIAATRGLILIPFFITIMLLRKSEHREII